MADKQLRKGKKKWFTILAPQEFKNVEVGETLSYEPEGLIGRGMNVNLMNLTGDPKKQNMEVALKINKVNGSIAETEAVGFYLVRTYVKRLARNGARKIDESYKFDLKDKIKIVIKPVIVTKSKTHNSVMAALRKKTYEFLKDYCDKNEYEKVLLSVTGNQLQRELQKILSKVYPVTVCQFRIVERI